MSIEKLLSEIVENKSDEDDIKRPEFEVTTEYRFKNIERKYKQLLSLKKLPPVSGKENYTAELKCIK